jgi:hypothetical protein
MLAFVLRQDVGYHWLRHAELLHWVHSRICVGNLGACLLCIGDECRVSPLSWAPVGGMKPRSVLAYSARRMKE